MIETAIGHLPAMGPSVIAGLASTYLYREARDSWGPTGRRIIAAGLGAFAAFISAMAWAVIG